MNKLFHYKVALAVITGLTCFISKGFCEEAPADQPNTEVHITFVNEQKEKQPVVEQNNIPAAIPAPAIVTVPTERNDDRPRIGKVLPRVSNEELARIINLSRRQVMLSQKMSKESLFILAGISSAQNAQELEKAIPVFEKILSGLEQGDAELKIPPSTNPKIKVQLQKTQTIFAQLKPVYYKIIEGQELLDEEVDVLKGQDLALLAELNTVARMYETRYGLHVNPVIDLAGQQRMLSQKMAKEILMIYLDIDHDQNVKELHKTGKLFSKTLEALTAGDQELGIAPVDNDAVKAQLDVINNVWSFIAPTVKNIEAMGRGGLTHFEMTAVDAFNMPLFQESNKVVALIKTSARKH